MLKVTQRNDIVVQDFKLFVKVKHGFSWCRGFIENVILLNYKVKIKLKNGKFSYKRFLLR